jgi:predicted nucleotidyltransferase
MMKNDPLKTIIKLINEKYPDAKAVFWSGSVYNKEATNASDLDIVIIYESLEHAYREAFIYDDWPIDAFIHDLDTLRYFCEELESHDGRPALINMILHGKAILDNQKVVESSKKIALQAKNTGPSEWSQFQIDKERFLITDILDDILYPKNTEEQMASAIHLFEPLIQFYFRANHKWAASGKSLLRLLSSENPELFLDITQSFENLFKAGNTSGVKKVVYTILEPFGGFLWDGFRADAPSDWKKLNEEL